MSQNKIIIAATTWEKKWTPLIPHFHNFFSSLKLLWTFNCSVLSRHLFGGKFSKSRNNPSPSKKNSVQNGQYDCNSQSRANFLSTISRRATFDRPFSGTLTAALDSLLLCLRALRAAAYSRAGVKPACDWAVRCAWSSEVSESVQLWDWVEKWLRVKVTRDNFVRDSSVKRFEIITVRRS